MREPGLTRLEEPQSEKPKSPRPCSPRPMRSLNHANSVLGIDGISLRASPPQQQQQQQQALANDITVRDAARVLLYAKPGPHDLTRLEK